MFDNNQIYYQNNQAKQGYSLLTQMLKTLIENIEDEEKKEELLNNLEEVKTSIDNVYKKIMKEIKCNETKNTETKKSKQK